MAKPICRLLMLVNHFNTYRENIILAFFSEFSVLYSVAIITAEREREGESKSKRVRERGGFTSIAFSCKSFVSFPDGAVSW